MASKDENDPNFWENRRNSLTRLRGDIARVRKFVQDLPSAPGSAQASKPAARKSAAPQRNAVSRPANGTRNGGLPAASNSKANDGKQNVQQKPPSGKARAPNGAAAKQVRQPVSHVAAANQAGVNQGDQEARGGNGDAQPVNSRLATVSSRALDAFGATLPSVSSQRSLSPLFSEPLFKPINFAPAVAPAAAAAAVAAPPEEKKPSPPSSPSTVLTVDSERMVPFARLSPSVFLQPDSRQESLRTDSRSASLRAASDSRSAKVEPKANVAVEQKTAPEQDPLTEPEKKGDTPERPPSAKQSEPEATAWSAAQRAARQRRHSRQRSADSAATSGRRGNRPQRPQRHSSVADDSDRESDRDRRTLPPPQTRGRPPPHPRLRPAEQLTGRHLLPPQAPRKPLLRTRPLLSGRPPLQDELQQRKYNGFLQARYPHIFNDALIPLPSPSLPAPPPPPVLQPPPPHLLVADVPQQNVYINTVRHSAAPVHREPRVTVEVHDYLDDLIDRELYEHFVPEVLRDCIEDLRSRDRNDLLRWHRVKFQFNHDEPCQDEFVEALVAETIEDEILPDFLTEMISHANEWLLDEDELLARAILDDLLSVDLTLSVQSLCKDMMTQLIDNYLKNHNDELTFEEVLALDWYDQTVTEEIRRVVQDSLDDLISAEILRHLAYEVYKQLMTERIREAQDTIIAEILFEVAVLDPVLEECIVERVVDEDVPKCAQEAINELSQAGLKRLETDVHHDFGRWLIDSFAADYVLGFFGLQGQTRFDSEGIDRALNSVLFDELFIAMLDIDRSHRGTLQNEANKFAYDKVFTGLAVEALLDRLVEETDQNMCDADADEVEKPGAAVLRDMDAYVFGMPDKYRVARAEAEAEAARLAAPVQADGAQASPTSGRGLSPQASRGQNPPASGRGLSPQASRGQNPPASGRQRSPQASRGQNPPASGRAKNPSGNAQNPPTSEWD